MKFFIAALALVAVGVNAQVIYSILLHLCSTRKEEEQRLTGS